MCLFSVRLSKALDYVYRSLVHKFKHDILHKDVCLKPKMLFPFIVFLKRIPLSMINKQLYNNTHRNLDVCSLRHTCTLTFICIHILIYMLKPVKGTFLKVKHAHWFSPSLVKVCIILWGWKVDALLIQESQLKDYFKCHHYVIRIILIINRSWKHYMAKKYLKFLTEI